MDPGALTASSLNHIKDSAHSVQDIQSQISNQSSANPSEKDLFQDILKSIEKEQNEFNNTIESVKNSITSTDPMSILSTQFEMFRLTYTVQMTSKASGMIAEDVKKLQSGQ